MSGRYRTGDRVRVAKGITDGVEFAGIGVVTGVKKRHVSTGVWVPVPDEVRVEFVDGRPSFWLSSELLPA